MNLATSPGKLSVREFAARALLSTKVQDPPMLVVSVSPQFLVRQEPSIATILTLVWAINAEVETLSHQAGEFLSHPRRRALILLVICVLNHRDEEAALAVTNLLPQGHVARQWAEGSSGAIIDHESLADLGDPMIIDAVLPYLAL